MHPGHATSETENVRRKTQTFEGANLAVYKKGRSGFKFASERKKIIKKEKGAGPNFYSRRAEVEQRGGPIMENIRHVFNIFLKQRKRQNNASKTT